VVTRDHPGKVIERPGCSVRINFVWITTLKSLVFVVSVNGSEWNAGEPKPAYQAFRYGAFPDSASTLRAQNQPTRDGWFSGFRFCFGGHLAPHFVNISLVCSGASAVSRGSKA